MKVIMTATRPHFDAMQNANRNADLCELVDNKLSITAIPVRGVWKGESEASYLFAGVNMSGVMYLHLTANLYEQEAILVIGDDNRAYLINSMGLRTDIGDWQKVRREIAIQFDGYSVIGGDYYVAATREQIVTAERRLLATQASVLSANEYAARTAASGV